MCKLPCGCDHSESVMDMFKTGITKCPTCNKKVDWKAAIMELGAEDGVDMKHWERCTDALINGNCDENGVCYIQVDSDTESEDYDSAYED